MARESRDSEARAAQRRDRGAFESLRDLPAHLIPDGMEALWVNEEVRGERQKNNLMARMNRDGYRPVLTSEIPALALKTLEQDKPTDEIIRYGGQVLMVRPKEWGIEDRAEQIGAAQDAEREAMHGRVTEGLDQRLAHDDPRERTTVRRERPRPQDRFPE